MDTLQKGLNQFLVSTKKLSDEIIINETSTLEGTVSLILKSV